MALPAGGLLVLLGLLVSLIPEPEFKISHGPQEVALVPVSNPDWAQNRMIASPQQAVSAPQKTASAQSALEPEKPPEKKKPEPIPGQVVDVAPTPDTDVPQDTHRVSEYNTHVQKESQARDKTAFYKNAMPKHTTVDQPTQLPGHDAADKVQAIGEPGAGKEKQENQSKRPGQKAEIPDVQPRDKLVLSRGPRGELLNAPGSQPVKGNSNRLKLQEGQGEAESQHTMGNGGTQAHLNLSPSQSVLDQIAGAPANDHLEGIDEGEGTYLNTREWKFAGFFNRVKQTVGEHWDPGTVMRRRDPSGDMYGWRDRRTILAVTLDKQGEVSDLSVEKSSGVDFLDEEAMAAFKRSQPFPNPPPALVDQDGQIKFSFGFYLQMNSGGLQLFRRQPD
jgi:TonB family protein